MKKVYFYFLFFCVLTATPGDYTAVSEIFFGSEDGKYYTIISEILNPGSYYKFKRNTYLAEYSAENRIVNKKILKREDIILDEDAKESSLSTRSIKNKGALENLLKKNINLSMHTFGNNKNYKSEDDGIYEISEKDKEIAVRIFSKEEILKKVRDICSKEYCSEEIDYDNEEVEVISAYYTGSSEFYVIKIDFDIGIINLIMKRRM